MIAGDSVRYKSMAEDGSMHIPPLYCISVATNETNLLDIISCNELLFAYYKKNTVRVLGLAASYKEAIQLVTSILMNVYNDTGGFDVRGYYRF